MGALDGLAKTANTLIEKFGRTITLRFVTDQDDYNPSALAGTDSTSDQTVRAVPDAYKARYRLADSPEGWQEGDVLELVAAEGLNRAPTTDDLLVIDSAEYEILHVHPIYAGDAVTLYQIHGRR